MSAARRQVRRAGAALSATAVSAFLASCGGTVSAPQCSFFSDVCNPTVGPINPITFAFASVEPTLATVQVGGSVTLVGEAVGIDAPLYQWSRSNDGGKSFAAVPGATASSFVLAGTPLTDDGVVFRFSVSHANSGAGALAQAQAVVRVSSMPPVAYQDSVFVTADWSVAAIAVPATSGPTHDEQQLATGGDPGAYRSMTHRLTAGASSLTVMHASSTASYDPATLGAIYVVDYAEDCRVSIATAATLFVKSTLLVDQGGRRHAANGNGCMSSGWSSQPSRSSLTAADFTQIAGPACGAGERCPDFAATAAPLRFGFVRSQSQASGPAATIVHDIDNWKVSVWRR